jgi:hypothetical protein
VAWSEPIALPLSRYPTSKAEALPEEAHTLTVSACDVRLLAAASDSMT